MRIRLPAARRWLAALCAGLLAVSAAAEPPAPAPAPAPAPPPPPASVFDSLFGADPASGRAGKAADGLSLPGLFADGKLLADALALHDLGPGQGACVAIAALLDAVEVRHEPVDGGISVTLPDPQRTILIPAAALLDSPNGRCLPLTAVPRHLPFSLTLDPVSQRLLLAAQAPLPALMRLAREARIAVLHPETLQPAFPLLPRPAAAAATLWSVDLGASLVHAAGRSDTALAAQASGALFGLTARAGLGLSNHAPLRFGLTLSDARDTPDMLGPLGARSIAIGDVASPSQPLIADALSGRGLVISSRPPWRADLVDDITLSGPLPPGWEAELWHEDRLVAVTRTADAAGQWRFADLPVRLGANRWEVRLYGPYGEHSEHVFTRLVGTEMNAENEVDYSIGFVDGGRPLLGPTPVRGRTGPAGFAALGWGVTPSMTARLGVHAPLASPPSLSLGLNGASAGTLWAATLARDGGSGLAGAVRLARRLGGTDLIADSARFGRTADAAQTAQAREFSALSSLSGQGRLALGRLSLPWQLRLQAGQRRSGGSAQAVSARLAVPVGGWQANAGLGLSRQGRSGWQGSASFGVATGTGAWRLRAGSDAMFSAGRWQLGGATLSAAHTSARGAVNLDLGWQAQSGRLSGGVSVGRRLGAVGLSASAAHGSDGWRLGVGLVVGLWQAGGHWHSAPAGLSRAGAIAADLFIDENGNGRRDTGEAPVAGGRFIVGNALRGETTGSDGRALIRALPAGAPVAIETQLSSLDDITLRPAHAGDRVQLRPGEVRSVPIPLHPTGSIDVQVLLASGAEPVPRSGMIVTLHDAAGREVASAVSDFDGHVLFDGLALGRYTARCGDMVSPVQTLERAAPDSAISLLIPPAAPAAP
ncbi:MAG: hypothetical protein WCO11_11465 [Sphingomonadales bacterium]|jgi:hypothetical protein